VENRSNLGMAVGADFYCSGYNESESLEVLDSLDTARLKFVRCGFVFAPGTRSDGKETKVKVDGIPYEQKLYTCASSVVASIKTVDLSINGSSDLSSLRIEAIRDAHQDEDNLPFWVSEKPSRARFLRNFNPLWGPVGSSAAAGVADGSDYDVFRGRKFYLPAASKNQIVNHAVDNFAVTHALQSAMNMVFQDAARPVGSFSAFDYSGATNFALNRKWSEMSATAEGTARIVNSIYTDIVASAVVSTRTRFGGDGELGSAEVRIHESRIMYRDIRYAIPAFLALALLMVLLLINIIGFAFRYIRISDIANWVAPWHIRGSAGP